MGFSVLLNKKVVSKIKNKYYIRDMYSPIEDNKSISKSDLMDKYNCNVDLILKQFGKANNDE